jgi:hypothetical protein
MAMDRALNEFSANRESTKGFSGQSLYATLVGAGGAPHTSSGGLGQAR